MTSEELQEFLNILDHAGTREALAGIYGEDMALENEKRLAGLLRRYKIVFGKAPLCVVTAPGRTELSGNHTDHNHGRVLAAAINLDCMALVSSAQDMSTVFFSEDYDPVMLDLGNTEPREDEAGKTVSLIRGVAHFLKEAGYEIGGFKGCMTSNIPAGVGLSSSAAFSVLMGRIFNHFFNQGRISPLEIALAAQKAENVHFGKPCGLMDQLACSVMGAVAVDFRDPDNPVVEPVPCPFDKAGIRLAVVNTGGTHDGLTGHYAAINQEMTAAAKVLGQDFARGITLDQILENLPLLRDEVGDRAALRLLHFVEENARVKLQAKALEDGDVEAYLDLAAASGRSSSLMLQNCFDPLRPEEQPITLALGLTKRFFGRRGACRVHGGGFAGTIQVYISEQRFGRYKTYMESIFGPGSVIPLNMRESGNHVAVLDGLWN